MSTVFTCPGCGVALRVDALGQGKGSWQQSQEFAFGTAPAGAEYSRETPAADMNTIEAGARLPLTQAIITSAAAMLLTTVACWYWYWPWTVAPVVGVIVGCLAWYLLLIQSRQLLSTRETTTADPGADDPAFTIEITEKLPERQRIQYAHFPARRPEVERFATACMNGWLTVNSPHRLSRRMFTQLRDVALDRGLLAWIHPDAHQQGVELTAVGSHVFKRLIA